VAFAWGDARALIASFIRESDPSNDSFCPPPIVEAEPLLLVTIPKFLAPLPDPPLIRPRVLLIGVLAKCENIACASGPASAEGSFEELPVIVKGPMDSIDSRGVREKVSGPSAKLNTESVDLMLTELSRGFGTEGLVIPLHRADTSICVRGEWKCCTISSKSNFKSLPVPVFDMGGIRFMSFDKVGVSAVIG
jgi:hypothetical protein